MAQWDKLNNVVLRKFSITWPLQIQLTPICKLADMLAIHRSKNPANVVTWLVGWSKGIYRMKVKNNDHIEII